MIFDQNRDQAPLNSRFGQLVKSQQNQASKIFSLVNMARTLFKLSYTDAKYTPLWNIIFFI